MALRRKLPLLQALAPHIAVIPECARHEIKSIADATTQTCWFGANPRKGLGVIVHAPWTIRRVGRASRKWLAPVWIGGPIEFLLIAVWTTQVKGGREASYIGQACKAVAAHPEWFASQPVVLCGDFNSNSIWDKTRKKLSHGRLVDRLSTKNITSAYHHFFAEPQGAETRPTHYFYHRQNRPFHIDYIFLPNEWTPKLNRVEVGQHAHWAKHSDHVPILADLEI